jgi:hypothetical protein
MRPNIFGGKRIMALSGAERKAFIEAAAALFALKEPAELIAEQQGGKIRDLSDAMVERARKVTSGVNDVCRAIYQIHGIQAIRFKERIFVVNADPISKTFKQVIVVPEDQIEVIAED